MGIKAKNGDIAGALSSIFNVDNRHFLSQKLAEINRFGYIHLLCFFHSSITVFKSMIYNFILSVLNETWKIFTPQSLVNNYYTPDKPGQLK